MRVPEHIKKKLHRIAWLHDRAGALMFEVERWLENNGFDLYQLRDGSGCGLEEFEYGEDITDEFVKRLEEIVGGQT